MNHAPIVRTVLAALLLGGALSAGAAHAQEVERVGTFHVRTRVDPITDEDRSAAALFPDGGGPEGTLVWVCGNPDTGLAVTLQLDDGVSGGGPADGARQRVVWRFDRDRPDSTWLYGLDSLWHVREDQAVSFTIRAKKASRLVIRVLDGAPRYAETDYIYDLTGSAAALDRLGCARNPRVSGPPAHRPPPPATWDLPDTDEATYELSAVEELPRITNAAEFQRVLMEGYPAQLRAARVEGRVTVRFRVLETGRVDAGSISVTEPSHEEFNAAAALAVQSLFLRPARVNGRPVKAWVELPILFTVGGESAATPPPPP